MERALEWTWQIFRKKWHKKVGQKHTFRHKLTPNHNFRMAYLHFSSTVMETTAHIIHEGISVDRMWHDRWIQTCHSIFLCLILIPFCAYVCGGDFRATTVALISSHTRVLDAWRLWRTWTFPSRAPRVTCLPCSISVIWTKKRLLRRKKLGGAVYTRTASRNIRLDICKHSLF